MEPPEQKQVTSTRRASVSAVPDRSGRLTRTLTLSNLTTRSLESLLPVSSNSGSSSTRPAHLGPAGNGASMTGAEGTGFPFPVVNRTTVLPPRPLSHLPPRQNLTHPPDNDAAVQQQPTPEAPTTSSTSQPYPQSTSQDDASRHFRNRMIARPAESLVGRRPNNDVSAHQSSVRTLDTLEESSEASTDSANSTMKEPATPRPTSEYREIPMPMPRSPSLPRRPSHVQREAFLNEMRLKGMDSPHLERILDEFIDEQEAVTEHPLPDKFVSAYPAGIEDEGAGKFTEKPYSQRRWKKQLKKLRSAIKKGWKWTRAMFKRWWDAFLLLWCGFENGRWMEGWH